MDARAIAAAARSIGVPRPCTPGDAERCCGSTLSFLVKFVCRGSFASVEMRLSIVTAVMILGASGVGCGGIVWMRPSLEVFDEQNDQACVETALRRSPDPASLESARERFESACEEGEAGACSALGVMYERGLAVKKNLKSAVTLFGRACQAGNGGGCLNLGMAYASGAAVVVDAEHAAVLFGVACAKGDVRGCTELGSVKARGMGVARDVRGAAKLLSDACSEPHAPACFRLASLFEDGTLGPDPVSAMSYYEKACIGGLGDGCDRLDAMFANSQRARHPTPHPSEAECRAGDARACNAAGLAYFSGDGVARDLARSVALLKQACAAGYKASCNVIGPMLHGSCVRGDGASCTILAKLSRSP